MSGKQTGLVWDHVIAGNRRLVLLALADAAEHDGSRCFPSTARVAWMTGLSRRTVQRHIDHLASPEVGVLIHVAKARQHRPTEWRLAVHKLPRKAPFRSDSLTPLTDGAGATTREVRGDKPDPRGVTRVTPYPSSYPSNERNRSRDRGLRRVGQAPKCRCSHYAMEHRHGGAGACATCGSCSAFSVLAVSA